MLKQVYLTGLGDKNCPVGKIIGGILVFKGTTYTSSTFISDSTHHQNIASSTLSERVEFPVRFNNGFDNTTDDANIVTSAAGYKTKDGTPVPSAIGYLDVSACDYQTMLGYKCGTWDFIPITDEGNQIGTLKSDDSYKGYRVKVDFVNGFPKSDNSQLNYPVYIFTQAQEEFNKSVFAVPSYSLQDLLDYIPAGLTVSVVTGGAYTTSGGELTVKVVERCTNAGVTDLLAANFPILESGATPQPVEVTGIVENGLGEYVLTIEKDIDGVPENLEVGDQFVLQVEETSGSFQTTVSNVFEREVKT